MNLNAGSISFAPISTPLPATAVSVHSGGWLPLGTVATGGVLPDSLGESVALANVSCDQSFTIHLDSVNRDLLHLLHGIRIPRSARSLRRRKANLRRKRQMRKKHR